MYAIEPTLSHKYPCADMLFGAFLIVSGNSSSKQQLNLKTKHFTQSLTCQPDSLKDTPTPENKRA